MVMVIVLVMFGGSAVFHGGCTVFRGRSTVFCYGTAFSLEIMHFFAAGLLSP